jgi:DNA polymerase III delta prime subunit
MNNQMILRKIIEENINICRFILISNTINNLIEPIQSRCFIMKTPGFTKSFIKKKINEIILTEKIKISKKNLNKLLEISNKNLKKAFMEIDFYLYLQKYEKEKDYFNIKNNNVDNDFFKLFSLISKKKLKYNEIDDLIFKLLIDYNIHINKIIKKLFHYIEIYIENDDLFEKIIDLNYNFNIKKINFNNTNKFITYLQTYIYQLNDILIKM